MDTPLSLLKNAYPMISMPSIKKLETKLVKYYKNSCRKWERHKKMKCEEAMNLLLMTNFVSLNFNYSYFTGLN